MPVTVAGVPVHPLVVHAVVVLIPLAALGIITLVVVPRWRKPHGLLVLILTVLAVGSVPVATSSGEDFQAAVPSTDLIKAHASLGNTMSWFAAPLLVAAAALWWLGRRDDRREPVGRGLTAVIAVASVVFALAAVGQVVRIGHSGAKAVWSGKVSTNG